jgi:membrane protein
MLVSSSPVASPLSSRRARFREFCARVYQKSAEDNILFMAGAISYTLLIAIVPLLLLAVGLWGYVLSARYGEPSEAMVGLLQNYVPAMGGDIDFLAEVEAGINGLVASRAGYSIVGFTLFVWLSTRVVTTLRIALREVFDIAAERSMVRGMLFDLRVVVVGGALLLLDVVITVVLQSLGGWGTEFLGIPEGLFGSTERALATLIAFMSTWALFVLVYWYVPAQRISWRTAWVAATVMAVSYWLMKWGFGWYVTSVADFGSAYGNLATVVVLLFWIYYVSVGFVLSGEVAQVYTMRKARKVQIRSAFGDSA